MSKSLKPHWSSSSGYKLAKLLQDSDNQKRKLASQVEELKDQLRSAETLCACLEEKVAQGAAKLEEQKAQIEHLQRQVKEKDTTLQSAMKHGNRLLSQINVMMAQNTSRKQSTEKTDELRQQLDRATYRLKQEKHLKNKYMNAEKKAKKEARRLQKICDKFKQQKNNNTELLASAALQQEFGLIQHQLNQENRLHVESSLTDVLLIRDLRATREHLEQQICELRAQNDAAVKERSLIRDVERLRSQIKELIASSLNTAEKVSEQEEHLVPESQAVKLLGEAAAPLENLPGKAKKNTSWKRFLMAVGLKQKKKAPGSTEKWDQILNNKILNKMLI